MKSLQCEMMVDRVGNCNCIKFGVVMTIKNAFGKSRPPDL